MAWIERHWQRITPVSALLYPLSLLFAAATAARRAAYRAGMLPAARLPVPVIVVGNVTVGGTGKTPLTLWLAAHLRGQGHSPAIVSRGYGGRGRDPREVTPESDPSDCGDEAVLLARRSGCPVWVGVDRVATARALLAANPRCSVILSDDGLQHYALARDVELCVLDTRRGFGNGLLLPAGPLREPVSRLESVDAVVLNGARGAAPGELGPQLPRGTPQIVMKIEGHRLRGVGNPDRHADASSLAGKRVHAVAGIGDPARYFSHLESLGLVPVPHAFPDHHPFAPADFSFAERAPVVMTEKDAVKCSRFAGEDWWALVVDAVPDPALGERVMKKLGALRS